jgi:predicted lipoprotein with Yx(FWY)xxD motif
MKNKKTYTALTALAVAAIVLVVSACGGGGDSGAEGSAPVGDTAATTVSVSTVEGVSEVLVDTEGAALYAADEEAGGMVLCVDSCTTIWEPLTLSEGQPTGSDGLGPSLGVATRPEGTQQVTFDGRLLYSFVEDPGPGTVTGNGFSDTFGDQPFTWHVATPRGMSTSSVNSSEDAADDATSPYSGGYGR